MVMEKKINWNHNFLWTLGKATSECGDLLLVWEATDPWKVYIGGNEVVDFPFIHAEDWRLAEYYAEKLI